MALVYVMRAFKTSSPTGYVFWSVYNQPDNTGSSSPYSPSELTNIIVINSYQDVVPTSGTLFAGLLEDPAGSPKFEPITYDMIQPAFIVSVKPSYAVTYSNTYYEIIEVSQPLTNITFNIQYAGVIGSVSSANLTNNKNIENIAASPPYNTVQSQSTLSSVTFGQNIIYTITATNNSVVKSGTATFNIGQKNYFGVGSTGQSSAGFITGLNSEIKNVRQGTYTVNPSNQKIYYAHRIAYGQMNPTDFVVGGFAGGFTNTATVSITNTYGFAENYYLYESDNLLTEAVTFSTL